MKHMEKNGFTLIELLVAMAIASIVGVVMVSAYQVQVRAKNTQEAFTDMNQAARASLEIMTNEIRMAGLDPIGNANARIFTASDGDLVLALDRRNNAGTNAPDADCCDPNEQIRYHLTNDADDDGVNDNIAGGVECHLGRQTGSGLIAALGCGGAANPLQQPLARNVDVLNFVYLAPDNTNLPADADILPDVLATPVATQALRDSIRSIQVTIVARAGTESVGFMYAFTNNDAYNNINPEGAEEILPAQGDHFRRLRLATTINCRNL